MSNVFLGFDHADIRVRSLSATESFYDWLMPYLGLTRKRYLHIDAGAWNEVTGNDPYNAIEYLEAVVDGRRPHFFGVIEHFATPSTMSRIAFRAPAQADYEALAQALAKAGARNIEPSADMASYPALFFEDLVGTKLEICG